MQLDLPYGKEQLSFELDSNRVAAVLTSQLERFHGKEKLQEVIRCKDCKHCMIFSMFTSKWYVCCRNEKGVDVKADDFCSYAERGNDETD